jgi:hypothetical protein
LDGSLDGRDGLLHRPETIEETAELAGGIAVRV